MTSQVIPRCYRHPDRETYISCQRCGKPICPDCMRQASVGFHCPDCVRDANRTVRQARTAYGGRANLAAASVTVTIIAINVAVFIAANITGAESGWVLRRLALFNDADFPRLGVEGVAQGSYWELITSTFLHVEPLHILMNMIGVWIFGSFLEMQLGRWRYLALYLVTGLAGSVLSYLVTPVVPGRGDLSYSLGASGSVFGLFGAALLILIQQRRDVRPLLMLVGVNLVFTFVASGISWQAHIGGLVSGLAIGAVYAYTPRDKRQVAHVGALVALLALCIALVVVRTAQITA